MKKIVKKTRRHLLLVTGSILTILASIGLVVDEDKDGEYTLGPADELTWVHEVYAETTTDGDGDGPGDGGSDGGSDGGAGNGANGGDGDDQ